MRPFFFIRVIASLALAAASFALVPAAAVAAEPPSVLIVMDGSGSMKRLDSAGTPLVDGAKQAVRGLIDRLPADARVGLRVYGTEVAGNDKTAGCRDSRLVAPVAPLDKARLTAAVDDIRAVGFTPIGYALEQAAKDLPAAGPRTIVLVSDGEDTCTPPDPCKVARELRSTGVDVTVESIGFKLEDDKARKQLTCIAKATGGSYRDAASAADLGEQLQAISGRAFRQAQTGAPIEGRPSPLEAPTLSPGTLHTDSILAKEKLYYAVDVQPGQAVRVTATVAPVRNAPKEQFRGSYRSVSLSFTDANGNSGNDILKTKTLLANTIDAGQPAGGTSVSEPAEPDTAGPWVFSVESDSGSSLLPADTEQSLQLQVELAGAVSGAGMATPPATDSPTTAVAARAADQRSGVPGWALVLMVLLIVVLTVAVAGLGVTVVVLLRRAGRTAGGR